MKNRVLFYEKQQFRQWFLWLPLLGLNLFLGYKFFIEKDFGNANFTIALIPITILLIIVILFWIMKLETFIYEDQIEIKFYPFKIHNTYKLNEIEKMEVIKYNPLLDYGGWGIKLGAYNISGNKGLKIYYRKNNYVDSILIGTQKQEELSKIINTLKNE